MLRRTLAVLLWAVIAAAFIGPGTVTTCASAGASFGHALLWTLVFATLACLTLQEAAARVTVVSGLDLGQALRARFENRWARVAVAVAVGGAIVLGCAAYEAGNILGAVVGAQMGLTRSTTTLTAVIGLFSGLLLWLAATRTVARLLGLVVAVMGVAFVVTAIRIAPPLTELIAGLLVPRLPAGSAMLALGLVGTTVVPYNLFLGSGLAHGQSLRQMRFGLGVAIVLGGLISMAVVVVGTTIAGEMTFEGLAATLGEGFGPRTLRLFGLGLFAAGFTSAITAPLAAAITARGLMAGPTDPEWHETGWRFRAVWLAVLAIGLGFGLADFKPIPVILLAQALNGLVLPGVSSFLWVLVNDRELLGEAINSTRANIAMGLTVVVTTLLGASALLRAAARALDRPAPEPLRLFAVAAGVAALLVAGLWLVIRQRRR